MHWLVVGSAGMLGVDLMEVITAAGGEVLGMDRDEIDITDPTGLDEAVRGIDVVVNCAAWTAVDAAESHEAEAFAVNATGAGLLAAATARQGGLSVQISTDYVFEGHASAPYRESAPPAPQSAYGRTKLAGEWAVRASNPQHLVVRTAWLYGAHGRCFPKVIAQVLADKGGADVVVDQIGQPTWTRDLSDLIVRLVTAKAPSGTYHGTSSGQTSWHGFAQAVAKTRSLAVETVRPTTSDTYQSAAARPAYSVLGHDALTAIGVDPIGDWLMRWEMSGSTVLGG